MARQLQEQIFCPTCNQQRLFCKDGTNHLVHAIVSLFLCGLWIPVWIIAAMLNSGKPYRCQQCGTPTRTSNGGAKVLGIVGGVVAFLLVGSLLAAIIAQSVHKLESPLPAAAPAGHINKAAEPASSDAGQAAPSQAVQSAPTKVSAAIATAAAEIAAEEKKAAADKATFKFHSDQAKVGNIGSMVRLGQLYLAGQGCQADTNEARIWFQRAADQGNAEAAQALKSLSPPP